MTFDTPEYFDETLSDLQGLNSSEVNMILAALLDAAGLVVTRTNKNASKQSEIKLVRKV